MLIENILDKVKLIFKYYYQSRIRHKFLGPLDFLHHNFMKSVFI
jgi:hypothetical protein